MIDDSRAIVPVEQRGVVASVSRQIAITEKILSNAQNNDCQETLNDILLELGDCQRCSLCNGRKSLVFGVGNPHAKLVIIGEAPGRDEDLQGEPFVGIAGQLLTKIIKAMGFERHEVYLCNVLKCRPPDNRNPNRHEISTCSQFLFRQIRAISPQAIITLGTTASQTLLNSQDPISWLRGLLHDYYGIPVMPTFHPAFLLKAPESKIDVWSDVKQVMQILNIPDPLAKLTYLDPQTGLMWARHGNIARKKMTWNDAMNWLKQLDYGGYSDWRLPSEDEFESFLKQKGKRAYEWLNANGFCEIQVKGYWSSSTCVYPVFAWNDNMEIEVNYYSRAYSSYVWPVRSIQY